MNRVSILRAVYALTVLGLSTFARAQVDNGPWQNEESHDRLCRSVGDATYAGWRIVHEENGSPRFGDTRTMPEGKKRMTRQIANAVYSDDYRTADDARNAIYAWCRDNIDYLMSLDAR